MKGKEASVKKKTQASTPNEASVNARNIQIIVHGDVINSNLNAVNDNHSAISHEMSLSSPRVISSKENKSKDDQPSANTGEGSREQYEKLISKVREQIKPLPAIVVYCLFKHFQCSDEPIIFSPLDDNSQFDNANRALENGYLISDDQFNYCFLINEYDPSVSKAIKWVEKLGGYLENAIDSDLYDALQSEFTFEPSITNKRYWENYLYGKPLY